MADKYTTSKLIADIVATVGVISLFIYVGLALVGLFGASLAAVTSMWFGLYSFVVLMSATKLYGKSTLEAVKKAGARISEGVGGQR